MKDESHGGGGSPPVTRRRWVDALLGGSLVAWAGAVIYPVLKYLTPPRDAGGASKVVLTDAQKQELASQGSLITRIGSDRVIVLEQKGGSLSPDKNNGLARPPREPVAFQP